MLLEYADQSHSIELLYDISKRFDDFTKPLMEVAWANNRYSGQFYGTNCNHNFSRISTLYYVAKFQRL